MAEETLSPPSTPTEATFDPATAATEAQASTPTTDTTTSEAAPVVDVASGVVTLEAASAATPTEGVPLQGETAPVRLTVGRIVHVVLDRGASTGDCRPAIVVRVWNDEMINAQLFTDGYNDHQDYAGGIAWKTSLHYAKPTPGQTPTPNTWHWSWED